VLSYTLGNGQTVTRTYDANYAVTDIVEPALELYFSRDAMGNITAVSKAGGGSASYGYDPLYGLTSVKWDGLFDRPFQVPRSYMTDPYK
jgi:hypothetical protein